ncbi:GP179 protein, partial [Origma solitaria]|nr:GP179 protein [Origma solitaria]
KAPEKGSKDRESICPWESLDTEQPLGRAQTGSSALPKAPSGKSQSSEKAEICPWEAQEPKFSGKAEICPWEVAETQVRNGRAPEKEATNAPEKSSKDRESICPWESPDTEEPQAKPQSGSSELPKAPSGKSQSSEKAEICPWESQDSKSSDKSEICPWEVAEPQLEKGTAPEKQKIPPKEGIKAVEKS